MNTFPKNFLWGAATASYQVEGGIENNDWAQAARDGMVPSCGDACDHYNRFEKDFDRAKELNHNFHRFSIEWARIEPREGQWDEKEIEHYRNVLKALNARGITPMVTCWHWTVPQWCAEKGGISNLNFPTYFKRYCKKLVAELGNEAHLWVTINEPLVVASHGYFKGSFPPFRRAPLTYIKTLDTLAEAHMCAYRLMKEERGDIRVGVAKHNIHFDANLNPYNKVRAAFANWWWNDRFLDTIRAHQDFIGLNHYHYVPFGFSPDLARTDMGWNIYPPALYHAIMRLREYNVPIYITESGLADADDSRRADYIRGYLEEVHRAISDGMPVLGYLYWSLLDNYEWTHGFEKRFGLIEVNYETFERRIRDSARVYADIITRNAL